MKTISNTKEFYSIAESNEISVVYFYANWCPDCFQVKPFLPRLESDYPNITFYQMNRDDDIDLARHLEIYGIPSFLVFKNGEELGRYVDKFRKSYIQVKEFIDDTIKE